MTFHIETKRLILRELRETDLESMFELDSNPEVHKYLGNKPIKTREEANTYLFNVINQYKERGIGRWAAIEKSTGNFMGWSGLRLYTENESFNTISNFHDVGFRLLPKYWGKGYATESGKAAVQYGFDTLNTETIYGITEMENQASHLVLLKIGLSYVEDFYDEKLDEHLRWYKIENK